MSLSSEPNDDQNDLFSEINAIFKQIAPPLNVLIDVLTMILPKITPGIVSFPGALNTKLLSTAQKIQSHTHSLQHKTKFIIQTKGNCQQKKVYLARFH